jgi:hypothetical protein
MSGWSGGVQSQPRVFSDYRKSPQDAWCGPPHGTAGGLGRAVQATALSMGTPGHAGERRDFRFALHRAARARIDSDRGQAHGFPFRDATRHVRSRLALCEALPGSGQGTSARRA